MTIQRIIGKLQFSVLIISLLLIAVVSYGMAVTAPIGAGYTAKYLCSKVFVGKQPADRVFAEEVSPANTLFSFVSYDVDTSNFSVTARTYGFLGETTAYFRPGVGCGLLDKKPEDLATGVPGEPSTANWPLGDGPAETVSVPDIYRGAFDYAFAEKLKRQTHAVLVIKDGELLAEAYNGEKGIQKDTKLLGWSMTKSITAMLLGIAANEAGWKMDVVPPVPEWSDKPEHQKIRLLDLLQMQSGLSFSEVYGPFSDATDMLYGSDDMAAFAADKPLPDKPGSTWYYSSGTTNILARLVCSHAAVSKMDCNDYIHGRLLQAIGANSAVVEQDASGVFVGSSYMWATARDWAKFGLLMLNDGKWQGKQILPEGWRDQMIQAASDSNGIYGGQIWLNAGRDNPEAKRERRLLKAPKNLYYFSGYNGQYVVMLPDQNMVVVRMGVTNDKKDFSLEKFLQLVLESENKKAALAF